MPEIRLFHATTEEAAKRILATGFVDGDGEPFGRGVFVSNAILSPAEGAKGDVALEISFESTPEEMFEVFEIQEGRQALQGVPDPRRPPQSIHDAARTGVGSGPFHSPLWRRLPVERLSTRRARKDMAGTAGNGRG
jgi:hypothetical protein